MDFWSGIAAKYHGTIRDMARPVARSKNETLFLEGSPFAGCYVVTGGSFRVYKGNAAGEEATLSLVYPGKLISAIPILTREAAYHADCASLEQSTALFLPAGPFRSLLLEYPDLLMDFANLLLAYALDIRSKYLDLMLKSSSERFLEFLRKNDEDGGWFALPVSKMHIAALLDVTPESLSRIISRLEADGKIAVRGRNFRIFPKT